MAEKSIKESGGIQAARERQLPKWARETLLDLRVELAGLRRQQAATEAAHAVLAGREWFTIRFPGEQAQEVTTLWDFSTRQPHAVCSLGREDVVLIGRKKIDKEKLKN